MKKKVRSFLTKNKDLTSSYILIKQQIQWFYPYSCHATIKGLKVTNERQDDGTGVLHQVAQLPTDQVYLYTRHRCPSPPTQDLSTKAFYIQLLQHTVQTTSNLPDLKRCLEPILRERRLWQYEIRAAKSSSSTVALKNPKWRIQGACLFHNILNAPWKWKSTSLGNKHK